MREKMGMEENTIRQTDEIEIDLWEICLVLIHNLALIVSVGIMVALGAFLFTQLLARASWVGGACAMVVMVFLWKPRLIPAFAIACVLAKHPPPVRGGGI